ncbi:MAG: hypothetical protein ACK5WZ_05000 [Pseudobdellovibrionaceae bacterium]
MKEALNLQELKSLLATSKEKSAFHFEKYNLEIPQGGITCISGFGKTEVVLDFLSERKDFFVGWIEEKFSFYPYAVSQKNLSLKNFLFIEAEDQGIYTSLQAMKSQVFQCIILYKDEIDLKDLRRIQIFSEKSKCVTFWLTNKRQSLWPVSLDLEAENSKELCVHQINKRF